MRSIRFIEKLEKFIFLWTSSWIRLSSASLNFKFWSLSSLSFDSSIKSSFHTDTWSSEGKPFRSKDKKRQNVHHQECKYTTFLPESLSSRSHLKTPHGKQCQAAIHQEKWNAVVHHHCPSILPRISNQSTRLKSRRQYSGNPQPKKYSGNRGSKGQPWNALGEFRVPCTVVYRPKAFKQYKLNRKNN